MRTIKDRVERRIRTASSKSVIVDRSMLEPTNYRVDVQGRGPTVEQLLDALMPVLSSTAAPGVYLWGPKGTGKSTVCIGLVTAFRRAGGHGGDSLFTTTRTDGRTVPIIAYVDLRTVSSEFAFYRGVLTSLVGPETVPTNGVPTDELRSRVERTLQTGVAPIIVTDHLEDPLGPATNDVRTWLDTLDLDVGWLAVGRDPPDTIGHSFDHRLELEPYRHHTLVDILSNRADIGLASGSITHAQLSAIADWAAGDAHDALTALFEAATATAKAEERQIDGDARRAAIATIPEETVSLHRLFALPDDRQTLLSGFGPLSASGTATVRSTAEALSNQPTVEFRTSTVKRILYELADVGFLRRRDDAATGSGRGRPPSTLEPQFPTPAFRKLHNC